MNRSAIDLRGVTKCYPLYGGALATALGAIGLRKSGLTTKTALDDVNLTIGHGEKVGIIGRNGSGKTTLLKLVIGHTRPTTGTVAVDGDVQAMMQGGIGFHDDLSGLDNAENALVYGGFDDAARRDALEDIVEFVELGEFIHHPVSTYSLGMRARLEFATATAIQPNILAIDEVLGAGDGYFVRKCAERMRAVIGGGTLLLVSHALDQITEYCDRVVWLDAGRVRADGRTQEVIREYQRFMARDEARIQEQLRASDMGQNLSFHQRARELHPSHESGLAVNALTLDRNALETGESLTANLTVSSSTPRELAPVLLGFSEHGALLFEVVGPVTRVSGTAEITLHSPRVGIGVGRYGIVPAVRDGERVVAVGELTVPLELLASNWSDPPLVHLDADWRDGDGRPLRSKVSAWV